MNCPSRIPPLLRTGATLALTLALGACVSSRGLHSDIVPAPVAAYATAQSVPAQGGTWPTLDWSRALGDPQLDALIAEAVAHSPTLAQARARVAKAAAYQEQAHASLVPNGGADASFHREHLSGNAGLPPPVGNSWQNESTVMLRATYELDLWGKNHEALRQAVSDAQASQAEAEQARLVLATTVAHTYLHLAWLDAIAQVLQGEVDSRAQIATLTDQRVRLGLDNEVETQTAQLALESTRTELADVAGQRDVTRYQLAALLGQGPDRGLAITAPTVLDAPDPVLPDTLPADLLARRPDIVAAHWRIDAARHGIKVAKADFFPNVNLAAAVGLDAFGAGNLFETASRQIQAGPAIHLPLFDGGALRAQLKDRYADYEGAVAQYDQILVEALNQVATQVATLRAIEAQQRSAHNASVASERAYALEMIRFQAGLDPQLQVRATDVDRLEQRRRIATLRLQRFDAQVALIQALGGGYQDPVPAPASGPAP